MQKYYHTTLRLWKLLKPFHKHLYLELFSTLLIQAINIAIVFILAKTLDSLVNKNFNFAYQLLFAWLLINMIKQGIGYLAERNQVKNLSYSIQQYLQEYSFKNIFKLNISQYVEDHSAIKLQVLNNGERAAEGVINTMLLTLLPTFTQILFSVLAIAYYSPPIALFVTAVLFIAMIWINYFSVFLIPLLRRDTENWNGQSKIRVEAFQHLGLIKSVSVEENYLLKYLKDRKVFIEQTITTAMYRVNHANKRWSYFVFSRFVSYCMIVFYAAAGALTLGNVYAIITWINDCYNNIQHIIGAYRNIPTQFIDLEKYLDIIDKAPDFDENGTESFVAGDIIFKDLNFKYPKSEGIVLDNINLNIPNGKKVAFVGVSGSGKSTIIKLLLRMYDYTSGEINIGGKSLRDINAKSLRQAIGYVEQHVDLFDTSIRDNILFGLVDKNISKEKMDAVVHKARIDQFFHRLSESGLDTVIGERGVKLSGGERQRIGIARALVKDPSILIFDEATASLDTENEKYIQEAIDEASLGRTSIIIAHRLSTVLNADIIFVMHKGKLVGSGTHADLSTNNEYYQNLIKHQF